MWRLNVEFKEGRKDQIFSIYNIIVGFSGAMGIVAAPFFAILALSYIIDLIAADSNEIVTGIGRDISDMLILISISLFVAVAAVYFLRFLYWTRYFLRTWWREHTPPFESANAQDEPAEPTAVEETFRRAEISAKRWFIAGVGVYFGLIISIVTIDFLTTNFEFLQNIGTNRQEPMFPEDTMRYITEFGKNLPFIGAFSGFVSLLPGDTILEFIVINVPAIFYTVAMRNSVYIFEKIDYSLRKSTRWPPNRYTLYLVWSAISQLLTGFILLIFGIGL